MFKRRVEENVRSKLQNFKKIAVWGAGSSGRQALREYLSLLNIESIIDSNKKLEGAKVKGISIISPEEFLKSDYDCVVICVLAHLEVSSFLKTNNFKGEKYFVRDILINKDDSYGELYNLYIDMLVLKDRNWCEFIISKPQFLVNITYRLARFTKDKFPYLISLFFRALHSYTCAFFSIFIPDTVKAGPGLAFIHYGGIVIHPHVTLGAFCSIYHGTTIGSNYSGKVPELADHVTLYSGSSVLGDTFLSVYTTVGANSLVIDLKCLEPEKTLVGHPAKIIN